MFKMYLLLAGLCIGFTGVAQTDTTSSQSEKVDTIRIGSLIIVKKGAGHYENKDGSVKVSRAHIKHNVSTNWLIVDLGFANYTDNTNYANAIAAGVVSPGIGKGQFNLRTGKSVDVNIWLFMQRLNLISHVVNLKYGLGIELNNYRYESPLRYDKTANIFTEDLTRHYKKDKLAADYVTIPLMLNFNFTPNNFYNKSFGFSAGISAGYLYSSRQKMITSEDGKQKIHDDMYLRPFKISYVAEVQLGPVKVFGSLATQSMFEKGLDQTPYNIGLRLSNW
ncbi:MAG: outer membrane beta-barrel protein [Bacteroidota bacterium]